MIGRLLSVGGFTLLSRVAGFIRDVLMAAILGAGVLSDAFMVALRLPNHFRAIFAEGAFTAAFVPRFAGAATAGGTKPDSPAAHFANDVFAWQLAAQITILLVALAAMPFLIDVLAPGFRDNPAQRDLAITLTRITFPYLACVAIVTQLSAMLNAVHRFKAAAAAPVLLNIAMIGTLLVAPIFPTAAHAAAYGVLLAGVLELGFVWIAASRAGLSLKLGFPRWTPQMGEFFRGLGAVTIGAGSVQIGLFLDTIIASFLPAGELTALYYADRINQLPVGIIGVALGTVLLPDMSARLSSADERGASISQNRAVIVGLLLTLPCLAAFLIMPDLIMRALFARGAFAVEAADLSAMVLTAYGIGLPAFILIRCVVPTFYARRDTATPVRALVLALIVNVVVKITLVCGLSFGAVGLAIGTSLAAWANLGMLVLMARHRNILVATTESKRAILPIAATTMAAAVAFLIAVNVGPELFASIPWLHEEGTFFLALLLGGTAYFGTVAIFRRRLPLGSLGRRRAS